MVIELQANEVGNNPTGIFSVLSECSNETGPGSLVTSRNNFDPTMAKGAFRVPRPYVQNCAHTTLGLFYEGGVVKFKPLMCGSWSCPHCRKTLAARTLDRLRKGLESHSSSNLTFVTLTVDPQRFGAFRIGSAIWEDGRETNLWSEPTLEQFAWCSEVMSKEMKKLCDRLNRKAKRQGLEKFGYFRVIELHRNGWPHYHLVFHHSFFKSDQILRQLEGWKLGIVEAREISLDDAIGELAPYLVCSERKAGGHKAYQFAALALPKNFRLYSASRGLLPKLGQSEDVPKPLAAVVLRGTFSSYKKLLDSFGEQFEGGSQSAWICPAPAPTNQPHKPPSGVQAAGDAATVFFAELLHSEALHAPPSFFLSLEYGDGRQTHQGQDGRNGCNVSTFGACTSLDRSNSVASRLPS